MCDNLDMRPFGTSAQLARRRRRALDLLRHGQTATQVAQPVGTTAQSVRRWRREAHHPKAKSQQRGPGRPNRLSVSQRQHLLSAFSSVWYILQWLGWSCQKPQRRSLARDVKAIAHWKRSVGPQIKKVA